MKRKRLHAEGEFVFSHCLAAALILTEVTQNKEDKEEEENEGEEQDGRSLFLWHGAGTETPHVCCVGLTREFTVYM